MERDAAERQGQMEDQEAQRKEDPRGGEISEQQPESQPAGDGGGADAGGGGRDDQPRDQSGRDDAGEATGNPSSAG